MSSVENEISGGVFHDPVVMAQTANVHFHGQRRKTSRSALATVRHYVNHTDVLDRMDAVRQDCQREQASTRILLTGVPGIGTTAVVTRWLKDHEADLPGEYLHAFLAPDRNGRQVDPMTVLESWLDLLEVPKQDRPADLKALAALYRSLTRDVPVVVVVEGAQSAAQVVPLLPGSDDSVILITSHRRLAGLSGLHNVEVLRVGPLTFEHSDELLVRVGRLATTTRDARMPFVRACGGVPLALRIVADHLGALEPEAWPGFAAMLADRQTRLGAMRLDEVSLPEMLDVVYQSLAPEHARAYRLLGLHPTSSLDLGAFEALTQTSGESAAQLLGGLRNANLLDRDVDGGLYLNDLIHEHAWQKAQQDESETDRAAALDRIIGYYMDCAEAAEAALSSRWRHDPAGSYQRIAQARGADPQSTDAAVARLALLGSNVLAAGETARRTGRYDQAWRIGQALWTYCLRGGLHSDWITALDTAVAAALESHDHLALARMHYERGFAHQERFSLDRNDAELARTDLEEALRLAREPAEPRPEGYLRTESSALEALALLELRLGHPDRARGLVHQATTALDGVEHPRGRALLQYHGARILTALADYPTAESELHAAWQQFGTLANPDHYNQARTLLRLAENRRAAGDTTGAVTALDEAEPLMQRHGTPYQLAELLLLRGDIQRQRDDLGRAANDWTRAREAFSTASSTRAVEVEQRLSGNSGHGDGQ